MIEAARMCDCGAAISEAEHFATVEKYRAWGICPACAAMKWGFATQASLDDFEPNVPPDEAGTGSPAETPGGVGEDSPSVKP